MNLTPSFFGESVRLKNPLTIHPDLVFTDEPSTEIPAGTVGTFIRRVYRPFPGFVNVVRVHTDYWQGWCLLTDNEIEVLQ